MKLPRTIAVITEKEILLVLDTLTTKYNFKLVAPKFEYVLALIDGKSCIHLEGETNPKIYTTKSIIVNHMSFIDFKRNFIPTKLTFKLLY